MRPLSKVVPEWRDYTTDGILGGLMGMANGVAVTLVLTGPSWRWRTLTAIGIYAIGFVGLMGLLLIISLASLDVGRDVKTVKKRCPTP